MVNFDLSAVPRSCTALQFLLPLFLFSWLISPFIFPLLVFGCRFMFLSLFLFAPCFIFVLYLQLCTWFMLVSAPWCVQALSEKPDVRHRSHRAGECSCDKRCHLSALFWLGGRGGSLERVSFPCVGWVCGGGSRHLHRLWRGQPRDRNHS